MPKTIIDYSNTIVYKIVCNDLNITDLYVGHTTQFTKRKSSHKYNCNNKNSKGYHLKVYSTIRDNGGWDNWTMIEVEKYSCKDSNEAVARERYWFEKLLANLNNNYPNRSEKEYYSNDKIKMKLKEYKESNKDKIAKRV